jgi:hypothetical protein
MNKITRDDTEHGVEYVRADEAEAEIESIQDGADADKVIIQYHEATIKRLQAEIERLVELARADEREAIKDEWWMCVQSDLENGVKSLNEQAATKWRKEYPEIAKFGAWLNERGETK